MFRPLFSRVAQAPGSPSLALRVCAWIAFAATLLVAAGYTITRYYLWPELDRWRPEIEVALGDALGQSVRFGALVPGFDGFRPRVQIADVRVGAAELPAVLAIPRVDVTLSWRSVVTRAPRLVALRLVGTELAVTRDSERRWTVAGIAFDADAGDGKALRWLLEQRRITLEATRIRYDDRVAGRSATVSLELLTLDSLGRRHRLGVKAHEEAIGALDFAAEIYRAPGDDPLVLQGWTGDAQLDAKRFDWAALRPFLTGLVDAENPVARLERVRGALRGKLSFEAGQPVHAQAGFALADLRLAGLAQRPQWGLAQFDGELQARWDAQRQVIIDLESARIAAADGTAIALTGKDNQLRLDAAGAPLAIRLALAGFDIEKSLGLVRALPGVADTGPQWLSQVRSSGQIDELKLRWDRPAGGGDAPRYAFDLSFRDLGLRSEPIGESHWPSFAGLTGSARVTHEGGEARFEGSRSALTFPGIFEEPTIPLDTVEGKAHWTVRPAATAGGAPQVAVELQRLRFANADAAGEFSGRYRSGGKGAGVVDLSGTIERADARRVARYLPLKIGPKVPNWLASAIRAGRASAGHFRLRGDLADFPYRDPATGEFRVEARVSDAGLVYAPGWPGIERFEGRLAFERAGMAITMKSGAIFGARLGETSARIADFAEPMLRIEGSAEGPAQDMVRFVNESALRHRIDDFTRDTEVAGDARLELRLAISLREGGATRVNGTVLLAGNDVRVDRMLPPFRNVRGRLEFTEEQLALRSLTARLLDGPVQVDGETSGAGRFLLRATGTVGADGIRQVVDNAVTRRLAGTASYQAQIDVNRRAAQVHVESDLAGLASTLPAPFAKAASERWPLRVDVVPRPGTGSDGRADGDRIRVQLRDDVRLDVARERDPGSQKLRIRGAAFALNTPPVEAADGLRVSVEVPEIDLDVWNALLRDAPGAPAPAGTTLEVASDFTEGFTLLPDVISVIARRVRVANKDLDEVVFGASRVGGFWNANLRSRQINGFFNWRDAPADQHAGTLTARFTRLEIPPDRVGEFESLLDAEPLTLPALDIVADEFVLGTTELGGLELRATNARLPSGPSWKLERLVLEHPGATFRASGSWGSPQAKSRATELDFRLELRDAGRALETHGIRGALKGGAGRIDGKVRWTGSPLAIDHPSLRGELALNIGKGQFLKTDPGIAKLIGVLSLQSLPRRLTLDFRDVFAEGFAFDEIRGDVSIRNGVARTENLRMKGVAAQVKIEGSADIANETQNLQVEIRPEINAGIASLAYAAVNPVVGLGSFVAQIVLSKPLQEIFAKQYRIEGSWSDPRVTEVPSKGPGEPVR